MFDQFHHSPTTLQFLVALAVTLVLSLILTPIVRFFAFKIGAVDQPNARRINTKPMPSSGGLAVFLAFAAVSFFLLPNIIQIPFGGPGPIRHYQDYIWPYLLGGGIVLLTGLIDDIKEIRPLTKSLGIMLGAAVIFFLTNTRFDNFKIPFGGPLLVFPDWLAFLITLIWIFLITNAVNIIDGLDGLVAGVSTISLVTMGIASYFFLPAPNLFLTVTIFTLVAAILGFFPYNSHPAKIYLGDTGALFIGFMLSVLSLQGLKNATAVATLTPLIILGVPLTDSVVATIRRTLNKQKFYLPDRMHLHHRLLQLGFTQRGAVFVIYGIAVTFAFISIVLNISSRIGGVLLGIALLIGLELFIELVGIWGEKRNPLMNLLKFAGNADYRLDVLAQRKEKKLMNKKR